MRSYSFKNPVSFFDCFFFNSSFSIELFHQVNYFIALYVSFPISISIFVIYDFYLPGFCYPLLDSFNPISSSFDVNETIKKNGRETLRCDSTDISYDLISTPHELVQQKKNVPSLEQNGKTML